MMNLTISTLPEDGDIVLQLPAGEVLSELLAPVAVLYDGVHGLAGHVLLHLHLVQKVLQTVWRSGNLIMIIMIQIWMKSWLR